MSKLSLLFVFIITFTLASCSSGSNSSKTIKVPEDQTTIQAAIDIASDGDLILISPDIYFENLIWKNKKLTLASLFHTTGNKSYISQTIIDGTDATLGANTKAAIHVESTPQGSKIIGLTFQNGSDGIFAAGYVDILNCRVINNIDGLDYEPGGDFGAFGSSSGGGLVKDSLFENNADDGIDLDFTTASTIDNNVIQNNLDDGIEIRLHAYTGANTLYIHIKNNTISGNLEDGIQIIGYPNISNRLIRIEKNIITNTALAALGFMDNANTVEDLNGAQVLEPVYFINNTLSGNNHGITGGGNLVAINNIIVNTTNTALKNISTNSIATYNILWNNGLDIDNSLTDSNNNTYFSDPQLNNDFTLPNGSIAIDKGIDVFNWNGMSVLELSPTEYIGSAPDIGAFEYIAP